VMCVDHGKFMLTCEYAVHSFSMPQNELPQT
jgi:hypothetical protein